MAMLPDGSKLRTTILPRDGVIPAAPVRTTSISRARERVLPALALIAVLAATFLTAPAPRPAQVSTTASTTVQLTSILTSTELHQPVSKLMPDTRCPGSSTPCP